MAQEMTYAAAKVAGFDSGLFACKTDAFLRLGLAHDAAS